MATLTVLMGPPGAGKTTWLQANQRPGLVMCSTERIRTDTKLRESAAAAYIAALEGKARNGLQAGRDVVIDGCNTRQRERSRWLHLAHACGATTELVILDTPLQQALDAQASRTHPVPLDKVRRYHDQFRQALSVVHREGWAKVTHVPRDGHRTTPAAPTRRARGTTLQRGYGADHRRERAKWAPLVEAGQVRCWRPECGQPIRPGQPWDLGHDDHDRSVYRGPEHAACNRATRRASRQRPAPRPRNW
jgi:predicted kinase